MTTVWVGLCIRLSASELFISVFPYIPECSLCLLGVMPQGRRWRPLAAPGSTSWLAAIGWGQGHGSPPHWGPGPPWARASGGGRGHTTVRGDPGDSGGCLDGKRPLEPPLQLIESQAVICQSAVKDWAAARGPGPWSACK